MIKSSLTEPSVIITKMMIRLILSLPCVVYLNSETLKDVKTLKAVKTFNLVSVAD